MFSSAYAADILVTVSPPIDWIGVGVAVLIAVAFVGLIAYIHYLRKPGLQLGEETLEKFAETLEKFAERIRKNTTTVVNVNVPEPIIMYDGIKFSDQTALKEYKTTKGVK